MAGVTIELQGLNEVVGELKRRGLDVRAGLEVICHAGAAPVLADAQRRAPGSVATNLDKKTTAKRATRVEVSVGPVREKHIARFVEYGTAPHVISPRRRKRGRKKALAIPGWGVYARVRHPGARKQPFLRPAYQAQKANAEHEMAKATKRAVRG